MQIVCARSSCYRIRRSVRQTSVQRKLQGLGRCRVVSVDVGELLQKDILDSDRLLIEVAYARSKVQDVEELRLAVEEQLDSLLDSLKKPSSFQKTAKPETPELMIRKRLNWESEDDVFVKTTRNEETKPIETAEETETLSEEIDFEGELEGPLLRHRNCRLLTADEEKELAVKIQRLMKIENLKEEFEKVHNRKPSLTELSKMLEINVFQLQNEVREGVDAKQTMVSRNMRLVISIAAKLRPHGMALRDVVVDGATGLIRAIEKFDPEKGTKLSTYAHWWIRQSIMRANTESTRIIQVPINVNEEFQRMLRTRERHVKDHGAEPTDEELIEELGMTKRRYLAVKNAFRVSVRLDAPFSYTRDNSADSRGDSMEDPSALTAEDYYAKKTMVHDLELVISTLPEKEAMILRLRYGLVDGQERTLEEIGHFFNVTRERVRQIEAKALRKLRQRGENLKEYLEPVKQKIGRSVAASSLRGF